MIKVFIINLPTRRDRLEHISTQFENKKDLFCVKLMKPIQNEIPSVSLWLSIREIISKNQQEEYIIICEDDHQFTPDFSKENFVNCINKAIELEADILCGGVSWFKRAIEVSDNLFWVQFFTGLQFTVLFNKSFRTILEANFSEEDCADHKLSMLFEKKYVIHPFLSIQRDFGYSDVTTINNQKNRVENLFKVSDNILNFLKKIKRFYNNGI